MCEAPHALAPDQFAHAAQQMLIASEFERDEVPTCWSGGQDFAKRAATRRPRCAGMAEVSMKFPRSFVGQCEPEPEGPTGLASD